MRTTASPATPWVVTVAGDPAALQALYPDWLALWQSDLQADAFSHPSWFNTWWRHFGHGPQAAALVANTGGEWVPLPGDGWRPHVLTVRDPAGRLTAVLPLVQLNGAFRGIKGQVLSTPVNSHALRSGITTCGLHPGLADTLAGALATGFGWHLLLLDGLPLADPRVSALLDRLAQPPRHTVSSANWTHSHLSISTGWDDMLQAHDRNFRKHLFQNDRALAKLGDLQVRRLPAGDPEAWPLMVAVERRSWKAQHGEVVAQNPRLAGYYRDITALQAPGLAAETWVLNVAGEPAAVYLCLRDPRRLYTYKTYYDQRFAPSSRHSPSQVLLGRLIETIWTQGLERVDFVGEMPFVARWADSHPAYSHCLLRRRPWQHWLQTLGRVWPAGATP